ncbi:MAG: TIGR03619 family F420-dependent LLM class oxidoreductase [bacterium]|nr:TIGR03619 family F420-dependent LLM class oxidoreductase [bacterium]
MKVGIGMPEQQIGFDPGVLKEFAVRAEELGFDFISCVDHVLGTPHDRRDPPFAQGGFYDEKSVFHEPFTLLSFWAALTTRINLATCVLVLPQRQTALVAKQAAELAILSNHRFVMGVGSGWNYIEYESLGTDYRTRGRRLEEQVILMRRLWSEPVLDFTGDHHRVDRAGLNPLLEQPVPIWFGGFAKVQQDRCARLGDGFMWAGNTSWSRAGIEFIRQRATEVGRNPDDIAFQAGLGEAEGFVERANQWAAVGGTHASVRLGEGHGAELLDDLVRVRDEVGELLGSAV